MKGALFHKVKGLHWYWPSRPDKIQCWLRSDRAGDRGQLTSACRRTEAADARTVMPRRGFIKAGSVAMRKGELIFNLAFLLLPALLLGLLPVITLGIAYPVPLVLVVIGFVLFLTAKLSVIRAGKRFTFGPKQMDSSHRRLYFGGYALMVAGCALAVAQHFRWI